MGLAVVAGWGIRWASQRISEAADGRSFVTAPLALVDVFSEGHLVTRPELLEDLPRPESVVAEAFEADALEGWQWPAAAGPAGAAVQITASAGGFSSPRGLLVDIGAVATVPPRVARTVAVRPKASYRLIAYVRTRDLEPQASGGAGASIELFELGGDQAAQPLVVHRHLPRERGTSSDWRRLEYTLQTSGATRELRVELVAAHGPATGQAWFDEVVLEEIPPLADLLSRSPYSDPSRVADPHPLVRRINLNGLDERPSIVAPPGTRWRLAVAPDTDTMLRTALSIYPLGGPSRFCFAVHWDPVRAGAATELAKHCSESAPASSPDWHEVTVDLAPYDGELGHLVFSTLGKGGGVGVWGHPRLVAKDRQPEDQRPDLVLLVIDTLRADHLGVEGYARRPTSPRLDQLAGQSVRFSRAYSTSPWTTPSFGSLLTSQYPAQHRGGARIERERHLREPQKAVAGGEAQKAWQPWEVQLLSDLFERATSLKFRGLDRGEITLAERLRAAGYDTLGFHSNYNLSGLVGMSRGFDRYQLYWNTSVDGAYQGLAEVRSWLEDRRQVGEKRPFFLLFHLQDPHMPYRIRREQFETFGPPGLDPSSLPEAGETIRWVDDWALEFWNYARLRQDGGGEDLEQAVAFYDSGIAHADQALGDLLDELSPNTAVALVADHGEEFGDHGEFEHGHSLYNELLRIPLFLKLPAGQRAGTVVEEPVSLVDVAPTLLELAEAEPLPAAEGRSLLISEETPRRRQGLIAEAMLRGPDRTAWIESRYKYVYTHPMGYLDPFYNPFGSEPRLEEERSRNVGKEELYDLVADPTEARNLMTAQVEVAQRLRGRVRAYLEETTPGIHLRCRSRDPLRLSLAFSESMSYLKPLTFEEPDEVQIDAARRTLSLVLAPDSDEEDAFVVRLHRPQGELRVTSQTAFDLYLGSSGRLAPQDGLPLGDPVLAGPPAARPENLGPWCQLWEVTRQATDEFRQLDAEAAEGLRALGYL